MIGVKHVNPDQGIETPVAELEDVGLGEREARESRSGD